MELWKDVAGYEGLYEISDAGNVRRNGKVLNHNVNVKNGYHSVQLCKNGVHKRVYVHRLVAVAFLPNPKNLPQINHKDEHKENNTVENLEWCSVKYNNNHGKNCPTQRISKRIKQITLNGKLIREWRSATEAGEKGGYSRQHISHCCAGKRKTSNGYRWEFA